MRPSEPAGAASAVAAGTQCPPLGQPPGEGIPGDRIRGARGLILFEADTNPRARRGADLLDIGGKVRAIGITAASGGTAELARITNPVQITRLVGLILRAPVDQTRPSRSPARYTLTFHLADGTSVARSYWPDSGELSRGIMMSRAFAAAIKRAAAAGRS
jgi:hypothetical protein